MKISLELVDYILPNLHSLYLDKQKTFAGSSDLDPIFRVRGGVLLKIKISLVPMDGLSPSMH